MSQFRNGKVPIAGQIRSLTLRAQSGQFGWVVRRAGYPAGFIIEGAKLMTTVGQRIREIRKSRNLTQRELADRVGINFTYLSRVENDRLDDEQTPREETLQRIAKALEADPDELLLLARRIPDAYRDRILSRPGVFRKLLNLSDSDLQDLVERMDRESGRSKSR